MLPDSPALAPPPALSPAPNSQPLTGVPGLQYQPQALDSWLPGPALRKEAPVPQLQGAWCRTCWRRAPQPWPPTLAWIPNQALRLRLQSQHPSNRVPAPWRPLLSKHPPEAPPPCPTIPWPSLHSWSPLATRYLSLAPFQSPAPASQFPGTWPPSPGPGSPEPREPDLFRVQAPRPSPQGT